MAAEHTTCKITLISGCAPDYVPAQSIASAERGAVGQSMSRVRIDPGAAVRVTSDPYASVLALACAGVRDCRTGVDTIPARIAVRKLSERAERAIAPLVAPGCSLAPDCLSPPDLDMDTDIASELDRLRSLSTDALSADLNHTFSGALPPPWVRPGHAPRQWVRDLADGLEAMWSAISPVWHREDRLRAHEAERVGMAAARGALDVVLAQAHPRGRMVDGALVFPDPDAVEINGSGLDVVLAPGLSFLDLSISNLERPDALWLAYPVTAVAAESAPRPDALDALLTRVRARTLCMLDGEWPMSEVAVALRMSPSTATRQIDALVEAGLVERRRDGRNILVHRTHRGTHVLDLYGVRPGHRSRSGQRREPIL